MLVVRPHKLAGPITQLFPAHQTTRPPPKFPQLELEIVQQWLAKKTNFFPS